LRSRLAVALCGLGNSAMLIHVCAFAKGNAADLGAVLLLFACLTTTLLVVVGLLPMLFVWGILLLIRAQLGMAVAFHPLF